MGVTTTKTNKPLNPRGNDQSPLAYNRAKLYSGKALDFDGVNDYIVDQTISIDTTSFSVSVYAKGDALGSNSSLLSFGDNSTFDLILYPYDSAASGVRIYDKQIPGTLLDGVIAELGVYNMFTMQCDGEFLELYINGQFVKKSARTYSSTYTRIQFGKVVTIAQYFDGQIANARLFNTALTAAQVADLYNNPEKVVPTGVDNTALKLWLPMMEGAGTTAYDGSGNGNHGTISGATYVNGVGAPVAQSAVIDWNKGSNLALYSEEFDNAYYNVNNTSKSANETTSPDGTQTADKITATGTNDHYIWNTSIALSGQNTISVFAKYNGYNIGIRPQGIGSGQAFANFDLQNGTILGSGGTYYDDSSITSFGDGWYRISMTMDVVSTYGINIYAVNGTTATELPSFTADGTSGYYLWGAQVNAGATLDPYVRTGATAQTTPVLLPQGLTSGRDITGVNLFENVRKQGALNLDGNSWAEVHDNASLDVTTGVSVEAWVYFDGAASRGILGRWYSTTGNRSYLLLSEDATNIRFYVYTSASSNIETGNALTANNWYHVVGTYDGTNQKIYINGSESATKATSGNIQTSSEALEIGRYYDETTGRALTNPIAQPRIYNRALTAEEVQRNYNAGKNIYTN